MSSRLAGLSTRKASAFYRPAATVGLTVPAATTPGMARDRPHRRRPATR
ncbi:hypothetical protein [Arboricoccus pini]|nr:hypothetical protein [Arboricoccus pini]